MRIALPAQPTPQVLGIDEFALRKGHRYATILTDAETGERIEVLPDRKTETVTAVVRLPGTRVRQLRVNTGLCLDARNAATSNGTSLVLWTCNGGTTQRRSQS
jgi:hypothetical protein